MRPVVRATIALVAVTLLVASFGGEASSGARAEVRPKAVKTVKGLATSWSPKVAGIAAGGTVRWRSVSGSHFLRAYGGNWRISESLPQGVSTLRRFSRGGTYLFRCTIHSSLIAGECSGMCGKVVVRRP